MTASPTPNGARPKEPQRGRSTDFDVIRVACITMVVIAHAANAYTMASPGSPIRLAGPYVDIAFMSGTVSVFIFMAGYFSSIRPGEPARAFYARRLPRLLWPYLAAFLFYFFVQKHRHDWMHMRPAEAVTDLLLGRASSHLWFIPVIIQLFLAFPLLEKLLRGSRTRLGAVLAALTTLHLSAALTLPLLSDDVAEALCPGYIFVFSAGILARRHLQLAALDTPPVRRAAMICLAAGTGLSAWSVHLDNLAAVPEAGYWGDVMEVAVAPLSAAGLFVALRTAARSLAGEDRGGWWTRLGACAFGVYLWHLPVLNVVKRLFAWACGQAYPDHFAYYLLAGPAAAALTFGLVLLLSRLRGSRYILG